MKIAVMTFRKGKYVKVVSFVMKHDKDAHDKYCYYNANGFILVSSVIVDENGNINR